MLRSKHAASIADNAPAVIPFYRDRSATKHAISGSIVYFPYL